MQSVNLKDDFENWLSKQIKEDGSPYSVKTIRGYIYALSKVTSDIHNQNLVKTELFSIDLLEEFISIVKLIKDSSNYDYLNKKYGNNQLSAAIAKYTEFLKFRNSSYITTGENEVGKEEINDQNELLAQKDFKAYTKIDFLSEVFINEEKYETLKSLLLRKKNLILQGAPGVGKTYAAKRLAFSIMGEKDNSRIKMIQFHQSYAYEDLVMGYRANGTGFELKEGPFYQFCVLASKNPSQKYFFIIDEINRGNISKVFGELLMLIEKDNREEEITLTYSSQPFSVPSNIYIIGMMNTADRSLAVIDYALRRRFVFFELEPAFESDSFKNNLLKMGANEDLINKIRMKIGSINLEISKDVNLGKGFRIGHSYFCDYIKSDSWYKEVIKYEIEPLLKEYWFDDEEKAKSLINELLR